MGCRQSVAYCPNCDAKRKRWETLQSRYLEKGVKEVNQFREGVCNRKAKLMYSIHYYSHLINREYLVEDVEKALLYGKVVERNKLLNESTVSYVLLYFSKNKPLHVVLDRLDNENYLLKTIYNPLAHNWKWNETFDKRICFCDSKH